MDNLCYKKYTHKKSLEVLGIHNSNASETHETILSCVIERNLEKSDVDSSTEPQEKENCLNSYTESNLEINMPTEVIFDLEKCIICGYVRDNKKIIQNIF